jgi:hypothetical protein
LEQENSNLRLQINELTRTVTDLNWQVREGNGKEERKESENQLSLLHEPDKFSNKKKHIDGIHNGNSDPEIISFSTCPQKHRQ